MSKETQTLLEVAIDLASISADGKITFEALIMASFDPRCPETCEVWEKFEIKKEDIRNAMTETFDEDVEEKMPALKMFTYSLTEKATNGGIDIISCLKYL